MRAYRSGEDAHAGRHRAFWATHRATCKCAALELREDHGLRCAKCDRPVVALTRRGT